MSLALTGKKKEQAEVFYDKLIKVLIDKNLPFMIGGTFAFNHYTGLERATGDIDIKCTFEDYPKILKVLSNHGYKTQLADIGRNWLAKVIDTDGYYTDIIFGERNGLYQIDHTWFDRAQKGEVLGHFVLLEPVEEMIRSKCYVQNRDRNDSIDVVHLILRQGKNVDWNILLEKMEPHWELLLSNILLFLFVYPSAREVIPNTIIERLVGLLNQRISHAPTKTKITRGLLLSTDYEVGISQWGFKPIMELK